jgi:hypothetical protein
MKREEWNLAKQILNQSKIRRTVSSLQPFKSEETNGIVTNTSTAKCRVLHITYMDFFLGSGGK